MGVEIFEDPVGQRIKALLMNYAMEHYESTPEQLEPGIDRTHLIVSFARQAIIDSLMAEVEVMTFRNVNSKDHQIPTLFIAGVLHAVDVAGGKGSVIGKGE
ncbi:hypothetical protein UFOVP688_30 [uncultured Caudovirales phage]|uniref:Uncharacterized protein n=1 Tax=uncultured Caudovirales phage TaxID=2100421 RepID=A0A6J5NKV7_9CAUD|nr:hypothetical protein UFOVP688_30 [uncultured Caudovirales phage]